jgi:hypothetical protein
MHVLTPLSKQIWETPIEITEFRPWIFFDRFPRYGTERIVKSAGSSPTFNSPHASSVATMAPGRARGQNEETAVALLHCGGSQ